MTIFFYFLEIFCSRLFFHTGIYIRFSNDNLFLIFCIVTYLTDNFDVSKSKFELIVFEQLGSFGILEGIKTIIKCKMFVINIKIQY